MSLSQPESSRNRLRSPTPSRLDDWSTATCEDPFPHSTLQYIRPCIQVVLPHVVPSSRTPALSRPPNFKVRHIVDVNYRAVLSPLTHFHAYPNHVPGPHAATYYVQHASVSGTLLTSEYSCISQVAGVMDSILGIYMQEQVAAWKEITDAVHEKKYEENSSSRASVLDPWLRRVNAVNFVIFSEDLEV